MPLARSLYLLPLALACVGLTAQEAPKTEEKAPAITATPTADKETCGSHHHRWHHASHATFAAYVQTSVPLRELKDSLDHRNGFGLGIQWTRDHGDWHASRTRLEWNTFAESNPVPTVWPAAYTKTYAKNYVLSFDHLFKLNQGKAQAYLVGGLGGARWCVEQTTMTSYDSRWTTKLALTGGVGVKLADRVSLEARYVVSSIGQTFDANMLQASLAFRF